jgi:hypothetical protein
LSKELRRRFGIETILADLFDYNVVLMAQILAPKVAIFILLTYGEDNPTDKANKL